MILQRLQAGRVELRVAQHDAGCVDQRNAMAGRLPGGIGNRIGVRAHPPLRCEQARLTLQLRHLFLADARVESSIKHADDGRQEQRNAKDQAKQKSGG